LIDTFMGELRFEGAVGSADMTADERRSAERDILYRTLGFLAAVTGAGVIMSTSASSPGWVASGTGVGWGWTVLMLTVPFLTIFLMWLAWVSLRRIVPSPPCVCGHPWESHRQRVLTVPCHACTCWTYLGTRRSRDASSS